MSKVKGISSGSSDSVLGGIFSVLSPTEKQLEAVSQSIARSLPGAVERDQFRVTSGVDVNSSIRRMGPGFADHVGAGELLIAIGVEIAVRGGGIVKDGKLADNQLTPGGVVGLGQALLFCRVYGSTVTAWRSKMR